MIFDSGYESEIREIIDKLGFPGLTCICKATGRGRTGPREGTIIWPGTNSIFLVLTEEDRVQRLVDELKKFSDEQRKARPVGLKVFSSEVEDLI
jgi:nitrogen regulatory protein PII